MKTNTAQFSLVLDIRRVKKDGSFPVKLRIFYQKIQRLYGIDINCTKQEFSSAYESKKTRKDFLVLRADLLAIESKAKNILDSLNPFTWQSFEKKMFFTTLGVKDVFHYYKNYETQLKEDSKILTEENYRLSRGSITRFLESQSIKSELLPFQDVTVDFLKKYERWMISKNCSLTTVGFYLRPLRAIFNLAIAEENISKEIYPFGKRQYQIPAGKNIKKTLSKEELKIFLQHPTTSLFQEKARAFWFFSYNCNGINIRDIVELKFKNVDSSKIVFNRSKTINTNRTHQKPIVAYINSYMEEVINKYSNEEKLQENYLFPIINDTMNKEEQVRTARAFTRYLNQHIKQLAKDAGITSDISTYWARHSFTTSAIRSGNSLEMLQEALGHSDMKTTMNYWAGFDNDAKKELSNKLMDF